MGGLSECGMCVHGQGECDLSFLTYAELSRVDRGILDSSDDLLLVILPKWSICLHICLHMPRYARYGTQIYGLLCFTRDRRQIKAGLVACRRKDRSYGWRP